MRALATNFKLDIYARSRDEESPVSYMDIAIWNLHYYDVVKRVSSLAGQWPHQRPKMRLLCVGLVTLSTFSINIPQIKDLTDRLFIDWNALETSEEYEIMKKYAKNGRRYSLGYSSVCLFMSMSLIPQLLDVVLPLNISRSILLTYPGYYFVDERKYFVYIFLHAVIAWEIAITGVLAHDCIFVTYVEHVCSMFAIVGYAQLLEDTFSVPFALQILIVTITMSITLLQVCIHLL
ncbi:PREDICTED: uncharacterized protein LOC105459588 [Wasmannia auropunctata]|uniref:uncharacterized protein LOC105459588 n=1 Tax=Wasmannia auropunctata TaxID=64793 RepID=UPI0005F06377|nr:PREDICTED: uncharacterized protein LOC105459588 [Wasmannia auropunctata]